MYLSLSASQNEVKELDRHPLRTRTEEAGLKT